ncbi:major anaerobically induced transmembrane protein [unidentified eubacterium SCB49]|nr:major anaerobically induced transmembrane protein [unidentified eubacterium SCB49]
MKNILTLLTLTLLLIACGSKENKKTEIASYTTEKQTPLEKSIADGKLVFKDFCSQCHRSNGKGVGKTFPPLAGSDWLRDKRTESIHAVKYGLKGEIVVNGKTYNGIMTSLGLSNQETADVMNYIMNSWGNTQDKMVTVEEVKAVLK